MTSRRPAYGQITCFTTGGTCLFLATFQIGGSSFWSGMVLMATGVALRAIDTWRNMHPTVQNSATATAPAA